MQNHREEILYERLIERLEKHLQLQSRGFTISYTSVHPNYEVVFDSPVCRIHSFLSIDLRDGEFTGVAYGRSHAPNDDMFIEWQGKKCIA